MRDSIPRFCLPFPVPPNMATRREGECGSAIASKREKETTDRQTDRQAETVLYKRVKPSLDQVSTSIRTIPRFIAENIANLCSETI